MSFTPPDAASRIEFGNDERAGATDKSSLVLASYNIRYAVGRYLIMSGLLRKLRYNFPSPRPEAIEQNIAIAARVFANNRLLPAPDILALQEADKLTVRAGRKHIARRLANELDMSYVHAGIGLPRGLPPRQREWWLNFEEQVSIDDEGDMGVAVLSRMPLSEIELIDLPWYECPWHPRVAVAANIRWQGQELRLFNVHIDPHGPLDNQHQQTEAVLDKSKAHAGPTVVLGDFNTLSRQKATEIRKLMEAHGYTTPFPNDIPTWRGAGVMRFHADWIFAKGITFKRWGVAKPLDVSDHWPIWTEIELSV